MDASQEFSAAEKSRSGDDASRARPTHATASRIIRQLRANLDCHTPSGDAFVVSIYGEWGIGKTYCLKSIRDSFEAALASDVEAIAAGRTPGQIAVPIFFDPWRYEHEEHLVIPLLKTIEYQLRALQDEIERKAEAAPSAASAASTVARGAIVALGRAAETFANVAIALAAGFKFKLAPLKAILGVDVELDAGKAIDKAADLAKRSEEARAAKAVAERKGLYTEVASDLIAAASAHESLYFETYAALQSLTRNAEFPLRLIVLIDDLDRCLPEKAVQVLESVKLFLNIPGFAFVLAVDDEIVERGIAYRYRDYDATGGLDGRGAAPISGAEYLEKIVHLPVHLQCWTKEEAAAFLKANYGPLFAPPAPREAAETAPGADKQLVGGAPRRDDDALAAGELIGLVTSAVPLVPRKLIRLAEGLMFLREQFDDLGELRTWSPLDAARLIALQQLYPALYRYVRSRPARYRRLFDVTRDDYGDPRYGSQSLHELTGLMKSRLADGAAPATGEQQPDTIRERHDLLACTQRASQVRGSPDPLLLFAGPVGDSIVAKLTDDAFFELYIHGIKPPAPAPAEAVAFDQRPLTAITDEARFLATLLDPDPVTRRELLQTAGIAGTRLPDGVFARLNERLATEPARSRLADIAWLRDLAEVISPQHLLAIYRDHAVLERLLDAESQEQER